MDSKKPISTHTFMFPFRWDFIYKNKDKEQLTYSKRTDLKKFDEIFSKKDTLKRTFFEIGDNRSKYNEFTYFHVFARKALYDIKATSFDSKEVLYYERDGLDEDFFEIAIKNKKTYRLNIQSVCLHVYKTGVGIVSYNLENYDPSTTPDDVLNINDFGRRIYPQFMDKYRRIEQTKEAFLADRIKGKLGEIFFEEDFSQYQTHYFKPEATFLPPDHIKKVFGYADLEPESKEQDFVFRYDHERKGNIRISLVTDDRMFFICYNSLNRISSFWNETTIKFDQEVYNYQLSDYWYKFIFGDTGYKTIQNQLMQIKHLEQHTYQRWTGENSYYGISRDSLICLADWDKLRIDMQTMYYQIAIICLVQRSSVLRFSYEVNNITTRMDAGINVNAEIKDLYRNYIEFINKLYFREVTSQIQGIEMYAKLQEVMSIEKEVKDLDDEINELHTYVSMDEQEKLSKIATWFLPFSIVAGFLGMNMLGDFSFNLEDQSSCNLPYSWMYLGIALVFSMLLAFVIDKIINRKKRR
ncbi:MAG: CorA family divalent cation transporter [Chitinophagales bacterium]|nr:CorA family divalent cation transporter [Chitinophagales bacterium]